MYIFKIRLSITLDVETPVTTLGTSVRQSVTVLLGIKTQRSYNLLAR